MITRCFNSHNRQEQVYVINFKVPSMSKQGRKMKPKGFFKGAIMNPEPIYDLEEP